VGYTEDLERALKTVEDGLKYGQAAPFCLEALERERQAWIEQHRMSQPRQQRTRPDHPMDGLNTLPIRPYLGYRGITIPKEHAHG
jgi:hypothetical protein